jgi:hypothetical protein
MNWFTKPRWSRWGITVSDVLMLALVIAVILITWLLDGRK